MSDNGPPFKIRSLDAALADLRDRYSHIPEDSLEERLWAVRMIETLEAEIAARRPHDPSA